MKACWIDLNQKPPLAAELVTCDSLCCWFITGLHVLHVEDAGELLRRDFTIPVHEHQEGIASISLHNERFNHRVFVHRQCCGRGFRPSMFFEIVEMGASIPYN